MYRWEVTVARMDTYGNGVEATYRASIVAADRDELVDKARDMFNARYDDFQKSWSYQVRNIESVREVTYD